MAIWSVTQDKSLLYFNHRIYEDWDKDKTKKPHFYVKSLDRSFPEVKGYIKNVSIDTVAWANGDYQTFSIFLEDADEKAKVSFSYSANSLDTLTLIGRLINAAKDNDLWLIYLKPFSSTNKAENGKTYTNTGVSLRLEGKPDTVIDALYKWNDFWQEENWHVKVVEVNNKKQYDRSTILNDLESKLDVINDKCTWVPAWLESTWDLTEDQWLADIDKTSEDTAFGSDEPSVEDQATIAATPKEAAPKDTLDDVVDDML